mmetsp:Transcript_3104/g.8988  ORF Transcript_3104/g.8988 Transcript_3104/m.8988 type:complete len:620 (+) Transcript_3104:733-2592(+)
MTVALRSRIEGLRSAIPAHRGLHLPTDITSARQQACFTPFRTRRAVCTRQLSVCWAMEAAAAPHSSQVASLGPDTGSDPDKPVYHVQPRSGWANDGNGFIYYNGRYHMFYQHVPGSADWAWRMCWGHASSKDLVHWEHEPIALRPTPGGPDDKGCWSGCCALDQNGVPVILYTGVRMGAGPDQLKPGERAISQPVVECQCAATSTPDDERLVSWTKVETPVIARPPPGLPVTGFRDPYVIQTGGNSREWLLLIGSGIDKQGGALLLYRSQQLSSGWEYVGPFCMGQQRPSDPLDTGAMWECPFFQQLPFQTGANGGTPTGGGDYVMCVSPYPHVRQHTTNPCLYWIGPYQDQALQFDLAAAQGPFRLDLGDVLYAPNCFRDGEGRLLMVGWMQEGASRDSSQFNYSGCLTLPRVLTQQGGRVVQTPAPELVGLRAREAAWHQAAPLTVDPAHPVAVPQLEGAALNLELTFDSSASPATSFSILLLAEVPEGAEGIGGVESGSSVAITVNWDDSTLKVLHLRPHAVDPTTGAFHPSDASASVGGTAQITRDAPVHLQLFLDHSALEVFLGTGEALTTRVYKRSPPSAGSGAAGVFLTAHGGTAVIAAGEAFAMNSIWATP